MQPLSLKKKILATSIILLVIIITVYSIYLYSTSKNNISSTEKTSSKTAVANDNIGLFLDSDNDGLRDWEEVLWKTDPQNPDTDRDGISDGEEANINREIFVEQYKTNGEVPDNTIKTEPAPQTKTQETGGAQSPQAEQNEFKTYGNIAGKVLKARGVELVYELDAFQKLGSKMTPEDFDNLKKSGDKYLNTSVNLTLISAPKDMETLHKDLISSYSQIASAIHNMASYKESGIVPVDVVLDYNKTALGIGEKILPIVSFFKERGIKFSTNEDGYIFVNPFE